MTSSSSDRRLPEEVASCKASMPAERRRIVVALHRLVLSLYPDARIDFSFRMPTCRHGRGWVAMANRKRHASLYTCDTHHIDGFRGLHPNTPTGKGRINLRPAGDLPLDDFAGVIRHAVDRPDRGA